MRILAIVVAVAIACLWRVAREPAPAPAPVRATSRSADLTRLARPVAQRSAAIVLPEHVAEVERVAEVEPVEALAEVESVALDADGPLDERPLDGPLDGPLDADEPLDEADQLARDTAELAAWNRAPDPDSIDLSGRAAYAEVIELEGYAVPIDTTSVGGPTLVDEPPPVPCYPLPD